MVVNFIKLIEDKLVLFIYDEVDYYCIFILLILFSKMNVFKYYK